MTRWVVYPNAAAGCVHLYLSSADYGRGERAWCGRQDPALISTDGRLVTCKTCQRARLAWLARQPQENENGNPGG